MKLHATAETTTDSTFLAEFCLVPNQSESCNYSRGLVRINQLFFSSLLVVDFGRSILGTVSLTSHCKQEFSFTDLTEIVFDPTFGGELNKSWDFESLQFAANHFIEMICR